MEQAPAKGNALQDGPVMGPGLSATPAPAGHGVGATPPGAARPHSHLRDTNVFIAIAGGFSSWYANEEAAMQATGAKVLIRCSAEMSDAGRLGNTMSSIIVTRPVVIESDLPDPHRTRARHE